MMNNLFLCQYGASRCSSRVSINPSSWTAAEHRLHPTRQSTSFKWDYLGVYGEIKAALEARKKQTTYLVFFYQSLLMKIRTWVKWVSTNGLLSPFRSDPGGVCQLHLGISASGLLILTSPADMQPSFKHQVLHFLDILPSLIHPLNRFTLINTCVPFVSE